MSIQPTSPLISVIMPVYNGAPYVAAAIQSILTQTETDFELILADDGSTDDSAAIIHAFAQQDGRVRPLFLTHSGESATLNAATALARGRWLALLKQDDLALPERLAIQLAWLQKSGIEIGGTCAEHFGDGRQVLWFPTAHKTICHEFLFRVGLLDSTIMLPTAIARENPWQAGVVMTDYEWLTRLVLRYRTGNLPAILVKYRSHAAQTHVAQQERCRADMNLYRRRYFSQRFPGASEADYQVFFTIANRLPCPSLPQLAQSGTWLVRLLDTTDRFQRETMAARWLGLCKRSTALGPGCYQLYQQYAPSFNDKVAAADLTLRVACTLRIQPQTWPYRLLQLLKTQSESFSKR